MSTAFFDPGLSGAIAISDQRRGETRPTWRVWDLPLMGAGKQVVLNGAAMADILRTYKVAHAVVEHVHAMPGQGVSGMFRFGTAFGQILGILQALGIPYELAQPAKWKREMRLAGGDGKGETARLRALELFPHMAKDLERKKDHNRAEALLIGRWWHKERRHEHKKPRKLGPKGIRRPRNVKRAPSRRAGRG